MQVLRVGAAWTWGLSGGLRPWFLCRTAGAIPHRGGRGGGRGPVGASLAARACVYAPAALRAPPKPAPHSCSERVAFVFARRGQRAERTHEARRAWRVRARRSLSATIAPRRGAYTFSGSPLPAERIPCGGDDGGVRVLRGVF
ncbi:unnamed protein product [Lampetra planeri]